MLDRRPDMVIPFTAVFDEAADRGRPLIVLRPENAVAKVMRDGLDVRPYQPWMENFQYANYVAISRKIVAGLP